MKVRCFWLCSICFVISFFATKLSNAQIKPLTDSTDFQRHERQIDDINMAAFHNYMTSPIKARSLAQEALLLSKRYKYNEGIGLSLCNIGKSYWAQAYYPISLFYFNLALPYLKNGTSTALTDCYRFLGRNYIDMQEYDKAGIYLKKAIATAGTDQRDLELVLRERSLLYYKLKQYDKSLIDIEKGLVIAHAFKRMGALGILYGRLSDVYVAQGQVAKAGAYTDTALSIAVKIRNNRLAAICLLDKANIYFRQKNIPLAINITQRAANLADSIGNLDVVTRASKMFYNIYTGIGNEKKALFYQQKYIDVQDKLNVIDKQNSSKLIQDYFALNAKLHDIEQIEYKNEVNSVLIRSQKLTIFNLVTTILVLTIGIYILYRNYRQKNNLSKELHAQHVEAVEQNRLIEIQSDKLNDLNQQKDNLLAIIGHDLKSPMANISTVIDLFEQDMITEYEVQKLMKDIAPAIKGAELTLNNLVEWAGSHIKGYQTNILPVDVLTVVNETLSLFNQQLAKKHINPYIEIPPSVLVMADEHHLKTILRNFLSNAIKFTGDHGAISLYTEKREHNWIIAVKDTGKGMSSDEIGRLFSTRTHFSKPGINGEKGSGIGLLLCRQLANSNAGNIGAFSDPGKGSVFYVTLPIAVKSAESV